MLADLRILTAPASDTPVLPPILAQFGADKYLFNAGEGTSRSCTQRKANLSRVSNLFVPHIGWEAIGGLPGVLMSQADGKRTESRLHGPTNLRYALATMRSYAKRDTMQLHINEIPALSEAESSDSSPIFRDQNLSVYAITLLPCQVASGSDSKEGIVAKKARLEPPSAPDHDALQIARQSLESTWRQPGWSPAQLQGASAVAWIHMVSDSLFNDSLLRKRQTASEAGASEVDLVDLEPSANGLVRTPAFVMSTLPTASRDLIVQSADEYRAQEHGSQAPVLLFVCEAHSQRGKFDPAKAAEAGVGPGPTYAALTRGEDIVVSRPRSWSQMDEASKKLWVHRHQTTAKARHKSAKGSSAVPETDPEPAEWAELEEVTVRSRDVMGASRAGAVFFQVYLPSAAYIPSLLTADAAGRFEPYSVEANAGKAPEQRRVPHVIVHAVPLAVVKDQRYQRWMAKFGPECCHIIANEEVCANKVMFPSCSTIPLRLSKLDDQLFQVPQYQLQPRTPLSEITDKSSTLSSLRLFAAEADQVVQLHPRGLPKRHSSGAPNFDFQLGSEEAEKLASFQLDSVKEADEQREHLDKLKNKNQNQRPKPTKSAFDQGQVGTALQKSQNAAAQLGLLRQARRREAQKQAWTDYLEAVQSVKAEAAARTDPTASIAPSDDVLITTLGTGSASPSKYRNVISTLIQTPNDGNILLDAGEATYGLLKRKFGCTRQGTASAANAAKGEDVDAILRNLRCLFISHNHADHHIGLIRILVERRRLVPRPSNPLYLVCTTFVRNYLQEYDRIEKLGLDQDVIILNNELLDFRSGVDPLEQTHAEASHTASSNRPDDPRLASELRSLHLGLNLDAKKSLNLAKLHTVRVIHRGSNCFGLVVRHNDSWSIVYSGDTRPCEELCAAGRDSTLLIHEATLEDSQLDMAITKGHSTFGEAIQVGQKMRVDNLLLTHFSQRYPKMARSTLFAASSDRSQVGAGTKEMPIALAFDLTTYPLSQFARIQKYTPALEKLFAADFEDEDSGSMAGDDGVLPEAQTAKEVNSADTASAPSVTAATSEARVESNQQKGAATVRETSTVPMGVESNQALHRSATTQNQCSTASAKSTASMRKSFHPTDFHYIRLRFVPHLAGVSLSGESSAWLQSTLKNQVTPATIDAIVRLCLDQLLGIVGGSVPCDILTLNPAEDRAEVSAFIRVAADYAKDVTAALAIQPDLAVLPTISVPSHIVIPDVLGGSARKTIKVRYDVHGPSPNLLALKSEASSREFQWQ